MAWLIKSRVAYWKPIRSLLWLFLQISLRFLTVIFQRPVDFDYNLDSGNHVPLRRLPKKEVWLAAAGCLHILTVATFDLVAALMQAFYKVELVTQCRGVAFRAFDPATTSASAPHDSMKSDSALISFSQDTYLGCLACSCISFLQNGGETYYMVRPAKSTCTRPSSQTACTYRGERCFNVTWTS